MKRTKLQLFPYVNGLIMLFVALTTLYPLWYVLVNSLLNYEDSMRGASLLWPSSFAFQSYTSLFRDNTILQGLWISVARTATATVSHVLFTAAVAYPLSKPYLVGQKLYMRLGLITMLFSGGLIPTFVLLYNMGLYDRFLVYIIPGLFSYYNMLIFRTFFKGMPASIEESAKVDGAGDFRIFATIVLPNAKAVIATISLYAIVYHWNDVLAGYIYIRSNALRPLQTILYRIVVENLGTQMQKQSMSTLGHKVAANSIKYAAMVVATAPVIMIYPLLQRYLVKGAMLGAIKE